MKFTKLMALALVLVMLVSSFVACGGTTDTETQAPETQAPEKTGGCGSMMSVGALLAIIPVAALVIKKKRD